MWKEDSVCLQVCPEEAVSTPGVHPASFFSPTTNLPSHPHSSSPPSLLSYCTMRSQEGETFPRQRNTAMPSNALSLLISLSQMQMCCTLLFASRPFHLEKCVLKSVGNPTNKNKKKCQKKVWLNQTKPVHVVFLAFITKKVWNSLLVHIWWTIQHE